MGLLFNLLRGGGCGYAGGGGDVCFWGGEGGEVEVQADAAGEGHFGGGEE